MRCVGPISTIPIEELKRQNVGQCPARWTHLVLFSHSRLRFYQQGLSSFSFRILAKASIKKSVSSQRVMGEAQVMTVKEAKSSTSAHSRTHQGCDASTTVPPPESVQVWTQRTWATETSRTPVPRTARNVFSAHTTNPATYCLKTRKRQHQRSQFCSETFWCSSSREQSDSAKTQPPRGCGTRN